MAKKIGKNKLKLADFPYSSFFSARLSSIIAIILLLASIGYLYAKNQELERKYEKQTQPFVLEPTITVLPTSTPEPTETNKKPVTIKEQIKPTSVPIERKVPVTLTDPTVAGTYYCYEDKANEIMTTQNNLNLVIKTLEICGTTLSFNIKTCFNDCTQKAQTCINNCYGSEDILACTHACDAPNKACGDACPKGTECSDKYSGDIDRLRSQLQQQKINYCP